MLKHYLKTAFRNIKKYKTVSFINIISLTIGLTTAMLLTLFIYQELSFDDFHNDTERLYHIAMTEIEEDGVISFGGTHKPLGPYFKSIYPEVESYVRIYHRRDQSAVINEEAFKIDNFYYTDPTFLDYFNFSIIAGPEEKALTEPRTLLISEKSARKYFGSGNPIGRHIEFDGVDFPITGVIETPPVNSSLQYDFIASFATVTKENIGINPESWNMISSNTTFIELKEGVDPQKFFDKSKTSVTEKLRDIWKSEYYLIYHPFDNIHFQMNPDVDLTTPTSPDTIYMRNGDYYCVSGTFRTCGI